MHPGGKRNVELGFGENGSNSHINRLFVVFRFTWFFNESSVDMVELAKIMEMVLDVVKRHSSHSSEVFWRDVGDLGAMLFGEA